MKMSVRGLSATALKADAVSLLVHRCETERPGVGDGVGVAPNVLATSSCSRRLHLALARSFVYASVSVCPPAGIDVMALYSDQLVAVTENDLTAAPSILTASAGAPSHWSPFARTVRLVIGLGALIAADSEPLPESTTARPPLAVESARIVPAGDIASASSVTRPVAENADSTGADAYAATPRTSAPTKRVARFMMASAIGDP